MVDSSNTDADRSVPSLNRGGESGLLKTVSLAAIIVVGVGALAWAVKGDTKEEVVEETTKQYAQAPAEERDIPKVKERPVIEPIVPKVREPRPTIQVARPDPRELEKQAAANQKRIDDDQRRQAELQNRRAPLLVFNAAATKEASRPDPALTQAYDIAQQRTDELAAIDRERLADTRARDAEEKEYRDRVREREFDSNSELYNESGNRFLRDAGESEVTTAKASLLKDQDYLITQGSMILGTLDTAIQSDLSGMLRATSSRDVYSRTGKNILIPRGSRLVGRYQSGVTNGQTRVFVVWTRVERPDGIVIDIASGGTDTLGRSGLGGTVDTHFFKRFGTSFLFSIIGTGIVVAADSEGTSQNTSQVIQDGGDSFQRSAEIALENSINIPPTIHVDQGERINIFVAKDLNFKTALDLVK